MGVWLVSPLLLLLLRGLLVDHTWGTWLLLGDILLLGYVLLLPIPMGDADNL